MIHVESWANKSAAIRFNWEVMINFLLNKDWKS